MSPSKLLRYAIVSLATLVGACASASAPSADLPTAVDEPWRQPTSPTWLWRVDHPSGSFFLFGTIHKGINFAKQAPPQVKQAFNGAEMLIVETDTSMLRPEDLRGSHSLRDQLSRKQWQRLQDVVPLPGAVLNSLHPAIAHAQVIVQLMPDTPSMDGYLEKVAKRGGKKMLYLEPVSHQLKVLKTLYTVEHLRRSLDNLEQGKRDTQELVQAYQQGDADKMWRMIGEDDSLSAEGRNQLLTARNHAWLDNIIEHGPGQKAFVAVGAAHLLGPEGLVALLSRRGYKVTRILP